MQEMRIHRGIYTGYVCEATAQIAELDIQTKHAMRGVSGLRSGCRWYEAVLLTNVFQDCEIRL